MLIGDRGLPSGGTVVQVSGVHPWGVPYSKGPQSIFVDEGPPQSTSTCQHAQEASLGFEAKPSCRCCVHGPGWGESQGELGALRDLI